MQQHTNNLKYVGMFLIGEKRKTASWRCVCAGGTDWYSPRDLCCLLYERRGATSRNSTVSILDSPGVSTFAIFPGVEVIGSTQMYSAESLQTTKSRPLPLML